MPDPKTAVPACECGVLPHRVWCPRKPFYDRAYNRIVQEHAKGLRTRDSPYQSVRADRWPA